MCNERFGMAVFGLGPTSTTLLWEGITSPILPQIRPTPPTSQLGLVCSRERRNAFNPAAVLGFTLYSIAVVTKQNNYNSCSSKLSENGLPGYKVTDHVEVTEYSAILILNLNFITALNFKHLFVDFM